MMYDCYCWALGFQKHEVYDDEPQTYGKCDGDILRRGKLKDTTCEGKSHEWTWHYCSKHAEMVFKKTKEELINLGHRVGCTENQEETWETIPSSTI